MPELRRNVVVASISIAALLAAACQPVGVLTPTHGVLTPSPVPPTATPTSPPQPVSPSPVIPTPGPTQASGAGILELVEDSTGMTMATDAAGTLHVAAATTVDASERFMAVYATCASQCGQAASWSSVTLAEASPGHVPTIALTGDGRPRIAYYIATGAFPGLHYLECERGCLDASNWKDLALSNGLSATPWPRPRLPFAVSPRGSAAYPYDDANGLQLLFCAADCANGASWSVQPIAGQFVVAESLAFGSDESLQVVARQRTVDTESLLFLDCTTNCASGQSWGAVMDLWRATGEIEALLARTATGGAQVALYADDPATPQLERVFGYLTCDSDCRTATNWRPALLPPIAANAAQVGYEFALDANDKPVLAYADDSTSGISRCSGECTTTSGIWQSSPSLGISDLDDNYPITVPASCLSASWSLYTGPALAFVGDKPIVALTASSKAFGGECGTGSTAIETNTFVVFPP